jgi:hypothetical protein
MLNTYVRSPAVVLLMVPEARRAAKWRIPSIPKVAIASSLDSARPLSLTLRRVSQACSRVRSSPRE